MSNMILVESNLDGIQTLQEDVGDGRRRTYLSGVFMEAETKNRNGRIYDLQEMTAEVEKFQAAAQQNRHILGHLDHPTNGSLDIMLRDVSHKIVELRMVGNQAIGKAEVLEKTEAGAILKGLIDSGINPGVSSRGRGSVGNDGKVRGFKLSTIDAVAVPSAQGAYPTSLIESLEHYRRSGELRYLVEAVQHDEAAQKYFAAEMKKFISSLKA